MDKAKKKQIKKITTWVLLAALVAILAAMPLLAKREAEADGPVATVHSGTVEEGTVQTSLHGGGTLLTEDVEDVVLPSGVKITEFLVKNGEVVTEGTPLAAVDKVSVMTAITSVTETMEYLQEEMKSAKDEKVSSTISATAGGRIKKVYAQKGDSVQEVMLRDGALALLSLDGKMAVEIEKKLDILTGDTVTVTLADGEKVTGRIASNLDGVIVITIEDAGYEIGQTVTVADKEGGEIGRGELYVHNAWTATAFSGIIQTAPAKEETKVSSGSTLFTLTETDFQGRLEYLSSLHREYEELMQDLFKMYNSGTIDAPCDGTIEGIDEDSPHLLAAEGEEPLVANLLTAEEGNWKVVLLSGGDGVGGTGGEKPPEGSVCNSGIGSDCPETELDKHDENCPKRCADSGTCKGTDKHYPTCIGSCDHAATPDKCDGTGDTSRHHEDCIKACSHAKRGETCGATAHHYLTCIESCKSSDGNTVCPATGNHKLNCIMSCTRADVLEGCSSERHHIDCIKACTTKEDCPASKHHDNCFFAEMTFKAKVALVTQKGSSELIVRWDASGKEYEVVKSGSGWKFKNPSDFNPTLLVNEGKISIGNPGAFRQGDVILDITGYKDNEAKWHDIDVYTNIGSAGAAMPYPGNLGDLSSMMPGLGDLSSLMAGLDGLSGFGNYSFYAPSPVEEKALFDLEGSTLMRVSPQKTVSLTITLDEQDIAKVSVGQKATVKVEALGNKTFTAEITEVANHGTNSGGSSKFTVKLEMPKETNMLDGMSATASLLLAETKTVPTIPVMALDQQGTQNVVYTALDEQGNPANPVPVTIGLSDGFTAEILSGLEVGDTYYYSYYDVLEEDTGVEERFTLT